MEYRLTGPARHERPLTPPEHGATMVEYVFLITLIAAVAAAGVILFGEAVLALFIRAESTFP